MRMELKIPCPPGAWTAVLSYEEGDKIVQVLLYFGDKDRPTHIGDVSKREFKRFADFVLPDRQKDSKKGT